MRIGPALIFLPPSRALGLGPRMVVPEARKIAAREAHRARRAQDSTVLAPGPRDAVAAFGPAPAASVADQRQASFGSCGLVQYGQQVAAVDLVPWPGADLADRPRAR